MSSIPKLYQLLSMSKKYIPKSFDRTGPVVQEILYRQESIASIPTPMLKPMGSIPKAVFPPSGEESNTEKKQNKQAQCVPSNTIPYSSAKDVKHNAHLTPYLPYTNLYGNPQISLNLPDFRKIGPYLPCIFNHSNTLNVFLQLCLNLYLKYHFTAECSFSLRLSIRPSEKVICVLSAFEYLE